MDAVRHAFVAGAAVGLGYQLRVKLRMAALRLVAGDFLVGGNGAACPIREEIHPGRYLPVQTDMHHPRQVVAHPRHEITVLRGETGNRRIHMPILDRADDPVGFQCLALAVPLNLHPARAAGRGLDP